MFWLAFLFVAAGAAWFILDGMRHEAESPDWPRHGSTTAASQFGESMGWWPHVDMWGYHFIGGDDPPKPIYATTMAEVTAEVRTDTQAVVEQPPKDQLWNIPGVNR